MPYDHKNLEAKWQKFWEENQTFATPSLSEKPKKFILDMFPYPSGTGLHVGHPKGYTATDIVGRYYHARGYNVLHPMGFDAFGLPAENFAIKTGTHPAITTAKNIETFITQLKALGFGHDWNRMIDTTDPKYYKWTQWIFLELFKKGLAYEQNLPINYCPSCKTGLANEEVLSDNTCDRCGTLVERRAIRQWVLKITDYAERLIADLDEVDWSESVKEMQRNWMGKSEGCEFRMLKDISPEIASEELLDCQKNSMLSKKNRLIWQLVRAKFISCGDDAETVQYLHDIKVLANEATHGEDNNFDYAEIYEELRNKIYFSVENNLSIAVYTTRVDTVFGMTYAVLAPDHPNVMDFITNEQKLDCLTYIEASKSKSDQDRTQDGKEKTGVFTGSYVINPFNGESVPLWIADYVLGHYGTGAVMAVPAHDERDFAFAKKYDLPITPTIYPENIAKKYREQADEKFFSSLTQEQADEHIRETQQLEDGFFDNLPFTDDGFIGNINYPTKTEEDTKKSQEIFAKIFLKSSHDARNIFAEMAEAENFGQKKTNYKLRDWLFSRQRYWGEPIPLIHLDHADLKKLPHITDITEATDVNLAYILKRPAESGERTEGCVCGSGKIRELVIGGKVFSKIYDGLTTKIVMDSRLPLELPETDDFLPAGDGESPLAKLDDWVNIHLADNLSGKRETNTMPQWGGSCWYYLRFLDPENNDAIASPKILEYWQNVDEYVGGTEHAVLHLLYARFWHKVLYDIGVVPTKEPFQKLVNQGMVLAYAYEKKDGGLVAVDLVEEKDGKYFIIETGEEVNRIVAKMSKSLKNTANPLDISEEHGADTLRLYEMFIGDFRDSAPWNPDAIIGVRRFLDKIYSLYTDGKNIAKDEIKTMKLLHKTIKKVEENIVEYKFNTAISAMMELVNEGLPTDSEMQDEWKEKFAIILHPFAPHMAEELWEMLGKKTSIFEATWPEYEEFMLVDDEVTIAVQVNGKLRGTLTCFNGVAQEEVSIMANNDPSIVKWTEGKILVREIFVPNKLLNIVVKDA